MARSKRKSFSESILNEEEKVISDIKALLGKKGVIPYLTSHPGVGKTSIIKRVNPNYLIYNVSLFNEFDLLGDEDNKPLWYNELIDLSSNSDECLLIFDDFDGINSSLQKYIFDLASKKRNINGLYLPDNAHILFCGVSEEYADSDNILDFKLNSILKRVEMKVHINEWIHWANKNGINNIVKSYLNDNPGELLKDIKDKNGKYSHTLSLTPRSWANRISNELNISKILGKDCNLDNYMDIKTKEKFIEYMNRYNELGVDDIICGNIKKVDRFTYNNNDISFITNALIVSVYESNELENAIEFLTKVGYSEYKDLFFSLWSSINSNNDDLLKIRNAILSVNKKGNKNNE